MPALSSDRPQTLANQLVVFTGKLSSLGRRDAQALVVSLGGQTAEDVNARTTILVIGGEGFGPGADRDKSNKLKRAEELNAQLPGSIEIISEDEFCRRAGTETPRALKQQYQPLRDLLARYRALREDQIRYLVKCGVLKPAMRTNADTWFAFGDVATIRQAHEELERGASFQTVVRSLMAARQGQLAFDFRIDAAPAKIITLQPRVKPRVPGPEPVAPSQRNTALAEEYFRIASALDDGTEENTEAAATAYRKALEADPCLVAALINLANIHYSRDELAEAQALYERAIALESDFFEAHFNLGNIYHDLGRFAEALECYRAALKLNPLYADTHFYLAVALEKLGLSQDARTYWRSYQQLAPNGEWVALAREFSE